MRDFRCHAVQLEDRDSLPAGERLARRHTQIEPAEVEALEARGDGIDGLRQRWRQQPTGVVEPRATAMAAAVAQHDHLSVRRHLIEMVSMLPEMKPRHTNRVDVLHNQVFEGTVPVTDH